MLFTAVANINVSAQTSVPENKQVKIMTYNIRHCCGMDEVYDCKRTVDVIRNSGAQFIGVQEVDSVTGRSEQRDILKELGTELHLFHTFGKAIDFDGGSYGIGILSAEKPLSVHRISLPGREEKRLLLVAEFNNFVLANVHISLTPEDALASVPIIIKEAQNWNKPFFLVGDWNTHPDEAFVKEISKHFDIISSTKDNTFPASGPNECIDYIALFKADIQPVVNCSTTVINDSIASDHRPIINTIEFK